MRPNTTLFSRLGSSVLALVACLGLSVATTGCVIVDETIIPDQPDQLPVDPGVLVSVAAGGEDLVVVQYESGGLWTVFNVCNFVGAGACDYDLVITALDTTTITMPLPTDEFDGNTDSLTQDADGTIHLVTFTTDNVPGITFETDPGATIEIDALLNGADDPSIFLSIGDGVEQFSTTNPTDFFPTSP